MNFPDCEIYNMPQRSPEWFEIRRGNITASTCGEWLTEGKKVRTTIDQAKALLTELGIEHKKTGKSEYFLSLLPDEYKIPTYSKEAERAMETAICDILDDMVEDPTVKERRPTADMQRGIDLEPEACKSFESTTGFEVDHVGFCQSLHGSFGCSPDGLIKDSSTGLEIKVLKKSTHIKYLRAGTLPREYRMQVEMSMAVTGADAWHFWAWQPCLPYLHVLTERSEFTERLKTALIEFSAELETAKKEMADLWAAQFGNAA